VVFKIEESHLSSSDSETSGDKYGNLFFFLFFVFVKNMLWIRLIK
jgi:hypothetical protein